MIVPKRKELIPEQKFNLHEKRVELEEGYWRWPGQSFLHVLLTLPDNAGMYRSFDIKHEPHTDLYTRGVVLRGVTPGIPHDIY